MIFGQKDRNTGWNPEHGTVRPRGKFGVLADPLVSTTTTSTTTTSTTTTSTTTTSTYSYSRSEP